MDTKKVREAIAKHGIHLPAMFVDLAVFDANTAKFAAAAARHNKTIRIATKSVRVPFLIQRVLASSPVFQGLMCYSVEEAALLAEQLGVSDLLVAYPTVQPSDVEQAWLLAQNDVNVKLMIDSVAHVDALDSICRALEQNRTLQRGATRRLKVCLDLDMSYRPLGLAHLGVQRSPVRSLEDVAAVVERILSTKTLTLAGCMGYEAQIAGVPDASANASQLVNGVLRGIKRISTADVAKRRQEVQRLLSSKFGISLEFFNGGGSGSIDTSVLEDVLTEVTVGSGLLQSTIFDGFASRLTNPAFCFALPVARHPQSDIVTCHGGGYIASGTVGADKHPSVIWPAGLQPLGMEGWGEVQTPFQLPSNLRASDLPLGSPVLCRPAKAGEISERFNEYYIIGEDERGGPVVLSAATYRGLGRACL
eukprot:TRINITY_DN6347_c0_g1_i1.p1 TRINITY_DN6347_c0_g1~~TRINITY_DN6347_c0_g1_i1.p1  ORF type:complete len:420 (-),score=98.85 TRINITY_DN6347_c0_g1_i1:30-1289(-)